MFSTRVVLLVLFLHLNFSFLNCDPYMIPPVQFTVAPRSFEASIPDAPNVTFFAFHGRLNEDLADGEPGEFIGEIRRPEGGRWVYKKDDLDLKVGDKIFYWVFVESGRLGYSLNNKEYTITGFNDITLDPCVNSRSTLDRNNVCGGAIIFEDDFNGNALNGSKWDVDHLIPANSQNYEFVSYQNSERVLSVSGGKLSIRPFAHIEEDDIRGLLDIRQGCTGSGNECLQQQLFYQILPPVTSGRIRSKTAFRYGRIEVRAKLPSGDWIYPQIRLTSSVQGAEIWVAYARGNKVLKGNNDDDLGASILFGGLAKGFEEPVRSELLRSWRSDKGTLWTDGFHNYTVLWEPSGLTLFVDGAQYGSIKSSEYQNHLNYEMRLTIGVGVGGINDFPDGYLSTSGVPKPWTNKDVKQMRQFFDAKDQWLPTWTNNSQLLIDFVKIYAL